MRPRSSSAWVLFVLAWAALLACKSRGTYSLSFPGVDADSPVVLPPGPGTGPLPLDPNKVAFLYAGGYTSNISVFTVDLSTGELGPRGHHAAGNNPSYLAFSPDYARLYAVNEVAGGAVAAFDIDSGSGSLAPLNRANSGGENPAYVSVDKTGQWIFVANYAGNSVEILPARAAGTGAPTDWRETGTQPHSAVMDPSNHFLLIPCKGSNEIRQFKFDPSTGRIAANTPSKISTAAGAGPRHLVFHPSGALAFVINEQNSTVTSYRFDAEAGTLSQIQTLSTLPDGVDPAGNTAADLHLHPNGTLLFGSNRGNDSIVVYRVDVDSGMLTLLGHAPSGGQTPRAFTFDPSGNLLWVANQDSNNITAFGVDPATGGLSFLGEVAQTIAPSFVGLASFPKR